MRGRRTRAATGLLSQYSEASCFAVGGTSFYGAWAKTLKKGHDRPNENELEGLRERVLIEVRRQKLKIAKSMAREGRVQPGPSAAPLPPPENMDSAMPDVDPLDDDLSRRLLRNNRLRWEVYGWADLKGPGSKHPQI